MNYLKTNYLTESSGYGVVSGNEDIIVKLGEIDIFDEETKQFKKVKAIDFIKVCNNALYKMMRDYPYLYQFLTKCKIMYIPVFPSDVCDTMCVDTLNNLWINFYYVYNTCKMNSDRVFGILFHEMFHVFFEHLLRFNEKYPEYMFRGSLAGVRKKANMKANICMDYEVNASMVEDGIVDASFWKKMNCLYKKEYTGMTWEEIMDKVGDLEYKEWLSNNGFSLEDVELKLLDAIEKASKVLMDKSATDEEKRAARKELQKKIDELLGKEMKAGEKSIQDELEELAESKLGDISDLKMDMEDVIDDLYKNPAGMSDDELNKTLNDIERMMDKMEENADEIGDTFGKSGEDVKEDVTKSKESLKKAIEKMKTGGLSKEEKQDLIDKAKDDLEDIISDDIEKEKLKKKREERDVKKEKERLEKFKKSHPLRTIINVLNNFILLDTFKLVSEDTIKYSQMGVDELEPLTELHFNDMTESDLKKTLDILAKLKDSLFLDLVKLINNDTILNKTKDDMHRLVDGVFDFVFNAFDKIFDKELDESAKGSVIKTAAQKLRIIGKVLKTQKVWKVGDDFKKAYIAEMKRLIKIQKEEGDEALFKELLKKGVINPMYLDENGKKLYSKLAGTIKPITTTDEDDIDVSHYLNDDEIEDYDGIIYYTLEDDEYYDMGLVLSLSDIPDGLEDSDYEKFAKKFEKDFPEYWLNEEMESVFTIVRRDGEEVDFNKLKKEIKSHPDYKPGEWD